MITVEFSQAAGFVALAITDDDTGDRVEIVMSPDEARGFSNNLGAAIQAASRTRTGVMT